MLDEEPQTEALPEPEAPPAPEPEPAAPIDPRAPVLGSWEGHDNWTCPFHPCGFARLEDRQAVADHIATQHKE